MKIWSKKGENTNELAQKFLCDSDIKNDENLVFWDAVGSIAHAQALAKAGAISGDEQKKLGSSLKGIISDWKKGRFKLDSELEDVHANIEARLTEKLGDIGKKIHTARSRNDQAALDLALYSKWELIVSLELLLGLCGSLLSSAKKSDFPMPGYTHSRKAMITTASHWALAHCEMLLSDAELGVSSLESIDKSPLGAGASFGSIVGIDRFAEARELGFTGIILNTQAAVGSRGKNALISLFPLGLAMQDLSSLSTDLIMLSGEGLAIMPEGFTTGSSIMPHKKNPDVLELVRAKSARFSGIQFGIESTMHSLPLGYNRDIQETKAQLMDGFGIAKSAFAVMDGLIAGLVFDEKACLDACSKEMCLADIATKMSLEGVPFRDAYRTASERDSRFKDLLDFRKNASMKKLAGGPGDKSMLQKLSKRKNLLSKNLQLKKSAFSSSIKGLSGYSNP